MKRFFVCLVIIGALCAALCWRINQLENDLQVKRLELESAARIGEAWRREAEEAINRAEGLAENARRCLAREAQAQAAARERAAIMEAAKPVERTEADRKKVVDDATRKRVIDRLNRDLRPAIPGRDANSLRRE